MVNCYLHHPHIYGVPNLREYVEMCHVGSITRIQTNQENTLARTALENSFQDLTKEEFLQVPILEQPTALRGKYARNNTLSRWTTNILAERQMSVHRYTKTKPTGLTRLQDYFAAPARREGPNLFLIHREQLQRNKIHFVEDLLTANGTKVKSWTEMRSHIKKKDKSRRPRGKAAQWYVNLAIHLTEREEPSAESYFETVYQPQDITDIEKLNRKLSDNREADIRLMSGRDYGKNPLHPPNRIYTTVQPPAFKTKLERDDDNLHQRDPQSRLAILDDTPGIDMIHIYTDGSVQDQGKDECAIGAGYHAFAADANGNKIPALPPAERRISVEYTAVSTKAEVLAIWAALKEVKNTNVIVFTDSMGAARKAQRMAADPENTKPNLQWNYFGLWNDINNILATRKRNGVSTTIQWIKAHSGIPGNERADQIAKDKWQLTGAQSDHMRLGGLPLNEQNSTTAKYYIKCQDMAVETSIRNFMSGQLHIKAGSELMQQKHLAELLKTENGTTLDIDWELTFKLLNGGVRVTSAHTRTSISTNRTFNIKLLTGRLPTMSILNRNYPKTYETDTCPRCMNTPETQQHLWECEKAKEAAASIMERLRANMERAIRAIPMMEKEKDDPAPDLTEEEIQTSVNLMNELPIFHNDNKKHLTESGSEEGALHEHQTHDHRLMSMSLTAKRIYKQCWQIESRHLKAGIIPKALWKFFAMLYRGHAINARPDDKATPTIHKDDVDWAKRITTSIQSYMLLEINEKIWEPRNEAKHELYPEHANFKYRPQPPKAGRENRQRHLSMDNGENAIQETAITDLQAAAEEDAPRQEPEEDEDTIMSEPDEATNDIRPEPESDHDTDMEQEHIGEWNDDYVLITAINEDNTEKRRINVPGDGNCFYHALALALRKPHHELRKETYRTLQSCTAIFGHTQNQLATYTREHRKNGHWAEAPSIYAMTHRYKIALYLHIIPDEAGETQVNITRYSPIDTPWQECRQIHILLSNNHYELLVPGLPTRVQQAQRQERPLLNQGRRRTNTAETAGDNRRRERRARLREEDLQPTSRNSRRNTIRKKGKASRNRQAAAENEDVVMEEEGDASEEEESNTNQSKNNDQQDPRRGTRRTQKIAKAVAKNKAGKRKAWSTICEIYSQLLAGRDHTRNHLLNPKSVASSAYKKHRTSIVRRLPKCRDGEDY